MTSHVNDLHQELGLFAGAGAQPLSGLGSGWAGTKGADSLSY